LAAEDVRELDSPVEARVVQAGPGDGAVALLDDVVEAPVVGGVRACDVRTWTGWRRCHVSPLGPRRDAAACRTSLSGPRCNCQQRRARKRVPRTAGGRR